MEGWRANGRALNRRRGDDARCDKFDCVYQGVVTNVLNPKVALFFLAYLPQFTKAGRGSIAWQIIFLGLLFNVSGTLVNVVVALLGGRIGEAFKKRPAFARKQRWVTGAVFIALGLRLAFAKRS
jgi:threonine/homoserine/homoserine lactone efflux protein